jgi:hypothetical protein
VAPIRLIPPSGKRRAMSQPQPAPYPYYPPQPPAHNHDKFIAAIIIAVVVTAVVAGGIGYGLGSLGNPTGTSPQPQSTQFTYTHGSVTMDSTNQGTPYLINFDSQNHGTLSSSVGSNGQIFQLYLPVGITYTVTIRWLNTSYGSQYFGVHVCTARPGVFTPSGSDYTQNFIC